MAGFNDRFGGSSLKPSDVSYRAVALSANQELSWPEFATDANVLARSMNVTPSGASLSLTLPDARESGPGMQSVWYNSGAFAYTIKANDGTPIATIDPGGRRLIELATNTTQGGSWISTLLGVGLGTLDVAAAAGGGLRASGTTLNVAFPVETFSANRVISEVDRDKVLIWTGGTGNVTLPSSSSVPDFSFELRNQGSGALTILLTGGETIDGVSSIILNNQESCWIHARTGSAWYTIGRGRNASFNFTQLQKSVTGGTVALTLTEAANVVQTYTGVLTSNVDIVLPAVVQVYYISNQTTGAFNFRLKNAATGQTVSLPQGQNAVVFSDGTNVINAATTVAGIGSLSFGAGTVGTPAVQVGAVNNGIYAPTTSSVGISAGGTAGLIINSNGTVVSVAGNAVQAVTSSGGTAFLQASRPAGSQGGLQLNTGNNARWIAGVDTAAEGGANAGSNFTINRYDDAGALIDSALSIDRKTGVTSITTLRDKSAIGQVIQMIGPAVARTGLALLNGSTLSRAAYPDLWAYAQTTTPVSEATWTANSSGCFSVGDGSTTFRVPDLRGIIPRGLDSGRGIDTGRVWGTFQLQQNLSHTHGVTDPSHVHGYSDPTHAHGIYDPTHSHTGSTDAQGNHAHGYDGWANTGAGAASGFAAVYAPTAAGTTAAGIHAHNIGTTANATGVQVYAAAIGITISAAVTGISVNATGSGGADLRMSNVAYPFYTRY